MRTSWIFWVCWIACLLFVTTVHGVKSRNREIVKRQAVKGNPGCFKEKAATQGIITSPNFPNNYPDSLDCYTEITLYYDELISFKFNTLEVEYEENCTADYVEIFDGLYESARSLGRYCSDPGKFIQSTSSVMMIHFHSDQVINNKGFSANYSVQKINETIDCFEKVTGLSGYVGTPDFITRLYPNNADCFTQITLPKGKKINFRFELVQIEYDEQCSLDYVEIFDGPTKESKSLGRFCTKPTKTFRSSGNSLLIHFHSDEDVNYAGFRAKYSHKEIVINDVPVVYEHFLSYPVSDRVPETSVHELKCIPTDPNLEWTWYKDGKPLIGANPLPNLKLEDDVLTIENMNPSLVGEYACEIQLDGKPFAAKAFINITKNKNCDFDIKRFESVSTKEGRYTRLECITTSEFLRISWKKNGKPVTNDTRIFLFGSGNLLIIEGIRQEDQGIYTCVAKDVVTKCEKRESVEVVVLKKSEVCGIPKVGRAISSKPSVAGGKIVGGNTAQKGAFPWQAMIWDTTKNLSVCGGSLLNKKWVLSAAHCIKLSTTPFYKLNVFLGKHDAAEREKEEQRRTIKRAEVHHAYSSSTHDNDVALLEMDNEVKYTNYIIPICLGEPHVIEESVFKKNSYKGTVTGWGRIIEGGAQARFLKEVRLPMVAQRECWKSTRLTVTKNMFCAGYAQETVGEARDACEGDSGGPFAIEFRNRWYVAGVVSWSEGVGACARKGKYGFYAKVNNYYTWISGLVGANEI